MLRRLKHVKTRVAWSRKRVPPESKLRTGKCGSINNQHVSGDADWDTEWNHVHSDKLSGKLEPKIWIRAIAYRNRNFFANAQFAKRSPNRSSNMWHVLQTGLAHF